MDLLGPTPKIQLEEWGLRTNLEHRNIRDSQPMKVGSHAKINDSLIYNGCLIEGEVERSIIFPGVHVKKGAVVKDSVLFFNNVVGRDCRLEKIISDVNVTIGNNVQIGKSMGNDDKNVTVLGWNNFFPDELIIGAGCTIYPRVDAAQLTRHINPGEVVR